MKKPVKKNPQIILHVEGGIVQDIISDSPVDVFLYDYDNIRDDWQCSPAESGLVSIGVGKYKKALAEHEKFVATQKALQTDDSESDGPNDETMEG